MQKLLGKGQVFLRCYILHLSNSFFFFFPDHSQKNMLKTRLAFRGFYPPPPSSQLLVFSTISDPSYCIRLPPSCLAGHNLLPFSEFLSATEGTQRHNMTVMQAAKILPDVSQHILNSVQIFLLALAGTDQKPSLMLKLLSKSRSFCPHLSSSQPWQSCSQNQLFGKCSD